MVYTKKNGQKAIVYSQCFTMMDMESQTGKFSRFDRTAAGEVEQESSLVTAERELFSKNTTGFINERMLKGTGVDVERGSLEA
jgi:hypothetical protein